MVYYRLDSTRLSFREYWRWKPGLPFLFMALRKILGIRINTGMRHVRPEAIEPIAADDVPEQHRAVLEPLIDQAKSLGFSFHFFYSSATEGPATGAAAALTSLDRLSLLLIVHAQPRNAPRRYAPAYSYFSYRIDGNVLATSGGTPGLAGVAPEFRVVKLRNQPLDQTWDRHSQRIQAESGCIPFHPKQAAESVLRLLQRSFDYNIERGILVPLAE